jgi:hypothetical protein
MSSGFSGSRASRFRAAAVVVVAVVVGALVLPAPSWAKDEGGKDKAKPDLPPAVLKAIKQHTPGLQVDDVRMLEAHGGPKVYLIDGDWEDKDVLMTVAEDGEVHRIRFHKRAEGQKPAKAAHSTEDFPEAVRSTAVRVVPNMQVSAVRSHQAKGGERTYQITGRAAEDGEEREVVLLVEADGDLLEARIIKPEKPAKPEEPRTGQGKEKAKGPDSGRKPEREPSDD